MSDSTTSKGREEQAIGRLRQRLLTVFRERGTAEVQDAVDRAVRRFTTARIREYVPLLVERISRDELSHRSPTGRGPRPGGREPEEATGREPDGP